MQTAATTTSPIARVATGRNANELADQLRDLDIPDEWTHEIVRRQILSLRWLTVPWRFWRAASMPG